MLKFKFVKVIILTLAVIFIVIKTTINISFWWLFLVLFIGFILTLLGSFSIKWNYFLNALHKNSGIKEDYIALTFDDGPDEENTPKVLDLLKKYNVKATFFCIGKNTHKHPQIIKDIIAQGHVIGNHSHSHRNNFGFLSTGQVKKDIISCQRTIFEATNLNTKFFRPPFGVTNPNIARAVKDLSLITFGWSVRSFDTVAKDADKVFKNISSQIEKGDIILLHDNNQLTLRVLDKLLKYCEKKDLRSVTLAKLFNTAAYA